VKPAPTNPIVTVTARGAARLRQGHVWVYRSDILAADELPPGALVTVADEKGNAIGTALYSSSSQIAIRMLAPAAVPVTDLSILIRERLRTAFAWREQVVGDSDACRLVFSEADFLPGLVVDRYNDVVSLQVLTQAMDQAAVRDTLISTIAELPGIAGIVERVEARIRELEQLPPHDAGLLWGEKSATVYAMNGVRFHYDGLAGQKTGAFLDQRENYAAAKRYAHGDALDVFCYQGGFALHLARKCQAVTGVDSSRPALEMAEENARLNEREIEWIEANAFDLLKDYAAAGRQYDTIVLDPPAFAKTKRTLDTALRGYKELNLRALRMLRPGGVLVTCSCSYHVSEADFLETLRAAALDAHRTPRLVERRGQSRDHPVLLAVPETAYLKCLILQV
jgi:23S rRNA (cytosine1962-C5)-methyltransferase